MSEDKKQGKLYERKVSALHIKEALKSSYVNSWHEYIPIEVLDEAKADIAAHTIPSSFALNLGGYVLVEKSVLLKWFGEVKK
jgi:hypothetical protein